MTNGLNLYAMYIIICAKLLPSYDLSTLHTKTKAAIDTFVLPTIEDPTNRNRGISGARILSSYNFKESPEMAPGYATDTTVFKTDPGAHLMDGKLPKIKIESDSVAGSPSTHTDDELYEDAGDLDFAGSTQGLYLTRIPKFLWETWSKLEDDEEIQLGTIRIEGTPDSVKRVWHHLLLDSS